MNPVEQHAANIAHGAAVGRLANPEFSPGEFVRDEMMRLPRDKRSVFLFRVAVAAVTEHAGTMVALKALQLVDETGAMTSVGMDPIEMLGRAAELRDQYDDRHQGETDEH